MAVTVGHEDVNGGNAGWTKKDVMDALENSIQESSISL